MTNKLFKITIIAILFLIASNLTINTGFTKDKQALPEYFKSNFLGTIGESQANLELEKDRNELTGSLDYKYNDKDQGYYISGKIKNDKTFSLEEVDQAYGKKTGQFEGKLENHILSGSISKLNGKIIPFKLIEKVSDLPKNFKKTYNEGSIGNKNIKMDISKEGNQIQGSYTIEKRNEPIKFTGNIDKYRVMHLTETDNNTIKGTIEGSLNEYMFEGLWFSADKKKVLQFWGRDTE